MARLVISANTSWNIWNFRAPLVRALLAHGHQVTVMAPRDRESEKLAELGARFIPLPMDNKGVNPVRDVWLAWRYLRLLRAERPDVYLGYTVKPNVYGSAACHLLGIPTINNVSGLGTAFIRDGLLTRIVERLYRMAFARADTVFFQNGDDRALFEDRRLVPAERVRLVPGSGIDLERFRPLPLPSRKRGRCVFVLVARLLHDKGVGEYAAAAASLRTRYPDAVFRLVGPLDVENRTAVARETVDGWVTDGTLEYAGPTDDPAAVMAQADCVVLPSYREGAPRTLLEGAALARPLVATDVPGCRDMVAEGVNGHLCAVRDAASLADAMEKVLSASHDERRAMGEASRALVEERYDVRHVIDAYREAIERALQR